MEKKGCPAYTAHFGEHAGRAMEAMLCLRRDDARGHADWVVTRLRNMKSACELDLDDNIREWEDLKAQTVSGMPEEVSGKMEQAYTNVVVKLLGKHE